LVKRTPWSRGVLEVAVIVGSILMAFGIEAWWGARQDGFHRAALLEDLEAEVLINRDALENTLERQRLRVSRLALVLGELTPEATGLSADSVRTLQAAVRNNPTYDPSFGVLNLLIQSGDLALLDDRILRARLAGLDAFLNDYLSNQGFLLELLLQEEVLFGTGSVVFDHSAVVPGDLTVTSASEDVRETAAKYLGMVSAVTELLIGEGETLLEELDEIFAVLRAR
jgi:hypothetical protein